MPNWANFINGCASVPGGGHVLRPGLAVARMVRPAEDRGEQAGGGDRGNMAEGGAIEGSGEGVFKLEWGMPLAVRGDAGGCSGALLTGSITFEFEGTHALSGTSRNLER